MTNKQKLLEIENNDFWYLFESDSALLAENYEWLIFQVNALRTVLAELAAGAPKVSEDVDVAVVKQYVLHKCLYALNDTGSQPGSSEGK